MSVERQSNENQTDVGSGRTGNREKKKMVRDVPGDSRETTYEYSFPSHSVTGASESVEVLRRY